MLLLLFFKSGCSSSFSICARNRAGLGTGLRNARALLWLDWLLFSVFPEVSGVIGRSERVVDGAARAGGWRWCQEGCSRNVFPSVMVVFVAQGQPPGLCGSLWGSNWRSMGWSWCSVLLLFVFLLEKSHNKSLDWWLICEPQISSCSLGPHGASL